MEENQEKLNNQNEETPKDFKDFDDDDNQAADIKRDIQALDNLEKQTEEQAQKEESEKKENDEITEENNEKETEENQTEDIKEEPETELSKWEELDKNNAVVKKYIIYISKDFIPYIDDLSTDERSAYINDAIQTKIDVEYAKRKQNKKKKLIAHLLVAIITICAMTPIALLGVNKAIMVTFENYKYSQDNFEKLYKQRFEKNKAYMRSIQYNKEHKKNN